MSLLQQIGMQCGTDKATAHKYCDFYEDQFKQRNFAPMRVLEIGVRDGSSLNMWKRFWSGADVIGVDIFPCSGPLDDGITFIHEDAMALFDVNKSGYWDERLGDELFDLIIDDGSHYTLDQILAFGIYYSSILRKGGIYIIEDIHTSFLFNYINSEKTTYELLRTRHLLGPTRKDDFTYRLWNREHPTDSMTAMIFKP